jgi:hypothetical protein
MPFLKSLGKHFSVEPKSHGGKQKDKKSMSRGGKQKHKEWERQQADNTAMKSEVEGALLLTIAYKTELEAVAYKAELEAIAYKAELKALKASAAAAGSRAGADMCYDCMLAVLELPSRYIPKS